MTSATGAGEMTCRWCGATLPTRSIALPGGKALRVPFPCTCEGARAERDAQDKELTRKARVEAFGRSWVRAGIPERFMHVAADFSHDEALARGGGLYVCGQNGRGKTWLACAMAKGRLVRTMRTMATGIVTPCASLLFLPAYRMSTEIRSSWSRWDQSEKDVFARWCGVDLLILDDLGKGKPGEWDAQNVFRVIDERWANRKATIITSQYSTKELAERMRGTDDATMHALLSRLRSWCEGIMLTGPDRRLEGVGDGLAKEVFANE